MSQQRSAFSGWALTRNCALALSAFFLARFVFWGGGEEGIRAVVRSTAQTSVLLFVAAFAASSLRQLWKNDATTWLLRNRRYVGVSFAFSHFVHLGALIAFALISPEFVAGLDATTLIGGGLAFAFIGAMAATSNDRAVAALGRTNWQRLHKLGAYYIWISFAQAYIPRALFVSPAYALPAVLLVVALGLRIYAARKQGTATTRNLADAGQASTN